jgi:hypothetical protein
MSSIINQQKIKQYTREEFDAMREDADWVMHDSKKNKSAQCVILVFAYLEGRAYEDQSFACAVFTSIEADTVACVDFRENMTYVEAINQASDQMFEEHQY